MWPDSGMDTTRRLAITDSAQIGTPYAEKVFASNIQRDSAT